MDEDIESDSDAFSLPDDEQNFEQEGDYDEDGGEYHHLKNSEY